MRHWKAKINHPVGTAATTTPTTATTTARAPAAAAAVAPTPASPAPASKPPSTAAVTAAATKKLAIPLLNRKMEKDSGDITKLLGLKAEATPAPSTTGTVVTTLALPASVDQQTVSAVLHVYDLFLQSQSPPFLTNFQRAADREIPRIFAGDSFHAVRDRVQGLSKPFSLLIGMIPALVPEARAMLARRVEMKAADVPSMDQFSI